MRVISRRAIRDFVDSLSGNRDRAAVKAALESWFHEARKARWSGPADVKRRYATASIVGPDRVVFNVKGNSFRLVVAIDYGKEIVWIKWIGTHKDYDRIDVRKVRYEKRN